MSDPRTLKQNRCIHKYCQFCADHFNSDGQYTFGVVVNRDALSLLQKCIDWLTNTPLTPDNLRRALIKRLEKVEKMLNIGEIPWTMIMVKNHIWRPIQISMFDKTSSTDLTTTECMEVYESMSILMSQSFGANIAWPSEESMSESQREVPNDTRV